MSLLLQPLYSGSRGNATYVEAGDVRLLVDAGATKAKLERALADIGRDPASLDGILVTHEHSDHVGGLDLFAARYGLKVFTNAETWAEIGPKMTRTPDVQRVVVATDSDFCIRGLNIETYEKPHDAVRSLGFGFYHNGARGAVITDLGHMPQRLLARLMGCELIVLESNHDEKMLLAGPYPVSLKKRILGREGHLSNRACGEALKALAAAGARQIALAHLSEENNRPEMAMETAEQALEDAGFPPKAGVVRLFVAGQEGPGEPMVSAAGNGYLVVG